LYLAFWLIESHPQWNCGINGFIPRILTHPINVIQWINCTNYSQFKIKLIASKPSVLVDMRVYVYVVAVWSGVNVAGTRLQEIHPDIGKANDPENWDQVHREVINRCAVLLYLRILYVGRVFYFTRSNPACTWPSFFITG